MPPICRLPFKSLYEAGFWKHFVPVEAFYFSTELLTCTLRLTNAEWGIEYPEGPDTRVIQDLGPQNP